VIGATAIEINRRMESDDKENKHSSDSEDEGSLASSVRTWFGFIIGEPRKPTSVDPLDFLRKRLCNKELDLGHGMADLGTIHLLPEVVAGEELQVIYLRNVTTHNSDHNNSPEVVPTLGRMQLTSLLSLFLSTSGVSRLVLHH